MAASFTYTCYLIDCSPSMNRPLDPSSSTSNDHNNNKRTRLDYALDFVRVKIAQRLINPKKTDQIAIVLFGYEETDNALAGDREGYENIIEFMQMRQPSFTDLKRLDSIKPGSRDVDLVAAIYVAGNLVRNAKAIRKDSKKQVILLTDADEPPFPDADRDEDEDENGIVPVITSWEDADWVDPLYKAIVPGMDGKTGKDIEWKQLFSLGVIGMDFGEPSIDEQYQSTWSPQQRTNIQGLNTLVSQINEYCEQHQQQPRALLGSVLSATAGASAPAIAPIKTVTKTTQLIIGDPDESPSESLVFNVMVQKATQKASGKSMQKMKKGAWHKNLADPLPDEDGGGIGKSGKRKRERTKSSRGGDDQEEDDGDAEEEDRTTFHDPGALVPEKQWYYVPDYAAEREKKKPKLDEDGNIIEDEDNDDDSEDEVEKAKRSEEARRLETDENLSRAYKYGSDLIPISKEEEQDFYLFPAGEPALMVRGFIKLANYHPEWALGDPYWLFGGDDSRSQLALSGLLWALKETKTLAVIRMLLPKITQPRVCLLMPKVGDSGVDDRMEMGLLIPMPFKEEIANWSFPSLDRIHTVTGKPVTEHRLLPKPDLLHSMDDFVDSMMLPVYADEDEQPEGEDMNGGETNAEVPTSCWFDANESYNPAIHNMRNCVIHKLLHPTEKITEDQEVHPALTRFLFPPDETMSASAVPAMSLSKAAALTLIPPKPKMTRGRYRKKQAEKPSKTALEELMGEAATGSDNEDGTQATQPWIAKSQRLYRHSGNDSQTQSQTQSQNQNQNQKPSNTASSSQAEKKPKVSPRKGAANEDDSDATEASDDDAVEEDVKPAGPKNGTSGSGRAKPSLLSYEDPIPDFEKLVKQAGMMTSQAMRQMCEIIPVFIEDAKNEADMQKPRDCIVHARRAAIEEDEVLLFNQLLHDVKEMLANPGAKHQSFLKRLKKENLGLVTRDESEQHHGDADALEGAVSQQDADKFWS